MKLFAKEMVKKYGMEYVTKFLSWLLKYLEF